MVLTLHVFRKLSPDGRISLYVGQRDFTDYLTHVDPIDGVVAVEADDIQDQKVFVQVVLTYRYGREEDEVMGLTFAKEIIVTSLQVFPKVPQKGSQTDHEEISPLQERLLKKLGKRSYPFTMNMPQEGPASVTLQPGQEDQGKPCGVHWELRAFVGDSENCPTPRKSCIRMGIRRQQYSPPQQVQQPVATCTKEFLLSPGKMHLHVTLDREIYYQGDPVAINLRVVNCSHKQVKRLKVSLAQLCDVSLGMSGQLRHTIASIETQEGCPVVHGETFERTFSLTPKSDGNHDKRGLAIQSNYHPQEPCLAASTLFPNPEQREIFGVLVSYVAKAKLCMGTLARDLSTEIPFTLMTLSPTAPPPPLIVPQLNFATFAEPKSSPRKGHEEGPNLVVEEGQGPAFSDTEPDTDDPAIKFSKLVFSSNSETARTEKEGLLKEFLHRDHRKNSSGKQGRRTDTSNGSKGYCAKRGKESAKPDFKALEEQFTNITTW